LQAEGVSIGPSVPVLERARLDDDRAGKSRSQDDDVVAVRVDRDGVAGACVKLFQAPLRLSLHHSFTLFLAFRVRRASRPSAIGGTI
jgi:hypothetical protein